MMETVVFDAGWESFFASHQLQSFNDFFNYGKGQTINCNTKRNVIVLELKDNSCKRTFYMKRFIHPHAKDMLSALYHYGKLCSQAEVEWRNAKTLLRYGIETYHPVCYGVRSFFGIELQSFFITEEINGTCLLDYLVDSWTSLDEAKKNDLVIRLAKFFQRIHAARIRLPDSYLWHVYQVVSGTPGVFQLAMIDLHRMQIRRSDLSSAAKDLGAFLFSLPDGFMNEFLRSLFIKNYLDGSGIRNQDSFWKRVRQWELKISNRRTRVLACLE